MCRFAVVFSKRLLDLGKIRQSFADLSKYAPAPDGDKQEDGWGVFIKDKRQVFQIKSTRAVWEDDMIADLGVRDRFRLFIHARSATFRSQKSGIDLNQPFIAGNLSFVFNGRISGVHLPESLNLYGRVGARKFFSLIERFYKKGVGLRQAVLKSVDLLKRKSRRIYGLNFAVADSDSLCVYSYCSAYEDYYRLFILERDDFLSISSAPGLDLKHAGFRKEDYCKIEFDKVLSFELKQYEWL